MTKTKKGPIGIMLRSEAGGFALFQEGHKVWQHFTDVRVFIPLRSERPEGTKLPLQEEGLPRPLYGEMVHLEIVDMTDGARLAVLT